jgi:hypothetical protein
MFHERAGIYMTLKEEVNLGRRVEVGRSGLQRHLEVGRSLVVCVRDSRGFLLAWRTKRAGRARVKVEEVYWQFGASLKCYGSL